MMGRLLRVKTTINAKRVSSRPVVCAITYTGTSAPTAGIILVDNIHIKISLVRWLRKKAIEYAAGAANARPSKVLATLVTSELPAYSK